MTHNKPYRTATYDRAVAALQALLTEEGPAQVYRACGDAVAYLQQAPSVTVSEPHAREKISDGPLLLTVAEAADHLGMSPRSAWNKVWSGELESVWVGSRRKVPRWAVPAYVVRLCEQQGINTSGVAAR